MAKRINAESGVMMAVVALTNVLVLGMLLRKDFDRGVHLAKRRVRLVELS